MRAIRQNDVIGLFILGGTNDLKGHRYVPISSATDTRCLAGSPNSQYPGFVQADIPLTLRGEVELLFFVVFVFCHRGIIRDGVGAGG